MVNGIQFCYNYIVACSFGEFREVKYTTCVNSKHHTPKSPLLNFHVAWWTKYMLPHGSICNLSPFPFCFSTSQDASTFLLCLSLSTSLIPSLSPSLLMQLYMFQCHLLATQTDSLVVNPSNCYTHYGRNLTTSTILWLFIFHPSPPLFSNQPLPLPFSPLWFSLFSVSCNGIFLATWKIKCQEFLWASFPNMYPPWPLYSLLYPFTYWEMSSYMVKSSYIESLWWL